MKIFLSLLTSLLCLSAPQPSPAITYEGTSGIGKGKHIVFLASDHEYRTEETSPALARILAKHHGFKCTVVFGVDKDGNIEAGSSNISGMAALKDADLFVIFARFSDEEPESDAEIGTFMPYKNPSTRLRRNTK